MAQLEDNYTEVSNVFIVGFPELQLEYFHMVAWFLFILYVTTVVGNLVLVVMFVVEHSLQKPMYIIMVSLALSDIGFATVALPKLIARYWWEDGSMGLYTCQFQRHMIHYFGSLHSLILLTMAVDRYMAICFPLRYPMLMTVPTMTVLTVLSWLVAHIFPGVTSINFTQIPFCFVIISYFCIIISVFHMTNGQGRKKTFSTCATQGCIISIYYIPRFVIYSTLLIPNLSMTPSSRVATTFFYSFFPPLINPFVYCLRTKEIKAIFRRWLQSLHGIEPKSSKIETVPKLK
ncbi:olfactory receptor 1-like [Fundulus diaphanus]